MADQAYHIANYDQRPTEEDSQIYNTPTKNTCFA